MLNSKQLDSLPPRILRFRLCLAKFDYTALHVPGKLLYTADALSWATNSPVKPTEDDVVVFSLPASKGRLGEYEKAQQEDPTLITIREYCSKSWAAKDSLEPELKPYWAVQSSLTLGNNLLLYNNRIVFPSALQRETIKKMHEDHQGIE